MQARLPGVRSWDDLRTDDQPALAWGLALKMVIVAEGVETREQMNWLRAHGCHIGQGYYFSPPVPAADVRQVIDRIEVRLAH